MSSQVNVYGRNNKYNNDSLQQQQQQESEMIRNEMFGSVKQKRQDFLIGRIIFLAKMYRTRRHVPEFLFSHMILVKGRWEHH